METTQRIERLPVDRILIDAYQRTLNNRRVERIAHHFNYGYKVGVVAAPMTITAINALSRIVETFGIAVLDKMLGYITAAWHGDPTAVRREMLAGFAEFTMRFGDRVTSEQFAARLGGKLPSDIFFAYRVRAEGRLTAHSAFVPLFRRLFCVIICDIYNKGMNSQSRQRLKMND